MKQSSLPPSLRWFLSCFSMAISFIMIIVAIASIAAIAALLFYLHYNTRRPMYEIVSIPATISAGLVAGGWVFVSRIVDLHWDAVQYRSQGWQIWTSNTNPANDPSANAPFRKLGAKLKSIIEECRGPTVTCIRLTRGVDFSAYTQANDSVIEIGAFALCAMDAEEVRAIIAHELGHLSEERQGLAEHEFYLHAYSLLQHLKIQRQRFRQISDSSTTEEEAGVERFFLSEWGRALRRGIRDVACGFAEDIFFYGAILATDHYLKRAINSDARRLCEFRCDQFAAARTSPDLMAHALARFGAVWMGYSVHTTELSDYRHRSEFGTNLHRALDLVRLFSTDHGDEARAARRMVLAHVPDNHPSTGERIERICPGSHLKSGEWSLPMPTTLVSNDEVLEILNWMANRREFASREAKESEQLIARDALLNFQDNSNSTLRQSLCSLEQAMVKKGKLPARNKTTQASSGRPRGAHAQPLPRKEPRERRQHRPRR